MPVVNGRLTCCSCGADLGDAEDPYRDPSCAECERRQAIAEAEAEDERDRWNDEPEEGGRLFFPGDEAALPSSMDAYLTRTPYHPYDDA